MSTDPVLPTRLQKLKAYAEHLLDVFIGLREKYALLDPLIFDKDTIRRSSAGSRGRGFVILKNTLFLSCLVDVSKIALDKDDKTPSVARLVEAMAEKDLCMHLREEFALWHLAPTAGEPEELIALLQASERQEEAQRRAQFDTLVAELDERWKSLRASAVLESCRVIRNKLLAHSELHHDGKGYRPLDVASLGLKWIDLKQVISELERMVDLVTLLYRNSSFAFDMLDEQLAKASSAFWGPTSQQ
jgi:hypothetical protein